MDLHSVKHKNDDPKDLTTLMLVSCNPRSGRTSGGSLRNVATLPGEILRDLCRIAVKLDYTHGPLLNLRTCYTLFLFKEKILRRKATAGGVVAGWGVLMAHRSPSALVTWQVFPVHEQGKREATGRPRSLGPSHSGPEHSPSGVKLTLDKFQDPVEYEPGAAKRPCTPRKWGSNCSPTPPHTSPTLRDVGEALRLVG
ncbi:hypothetical protein Sjap_023119 [Stephania japonica]|uniref:Uncharacterized protein n=1 Tax=Stephania japonica TaxID=461633 RepID=A0AAP0EVJ7_9MAGN